MTTLDADTFPTRPPAPSLREAPWIVLKFGGTSVSTARNWAGIHELLVERVAAGYRPLVVHSALAGVSNRIQDALGRVGREDVREQLAAIEAAHLALATEMQLDGNALVGGQLREL